MRSIHHAYPLSAIFFPAVVLMAWAMGEAVGAMRRVLADTVEYCKQRQQFGAPIGKFQGAEKFARYDILFEPVPIGKFHFIDGGIVSPVPVVPAYVNVMLHTLDHCAIAA